MQFRVTVLALSLSLASHLGFAEGPASTTQKVKAVSVTIPVHPGLAQFVRYNASPAGVTLKIRFIKDKGTNGQLYLTGGNFMAVGNLREANVFIKTPSGAAQDETYRTYLQVLSQCHTSARLNLRSAPGGSAFMEFIATEKNPVEVAIFPNEDNADPGDALQVNITSFKDLQMYCTN